MVVDVGIGHQGRRGGHHFHPGAFAHFGKRGRIEVFLQAYPYGFGTGQGAGVRMQGAALADGPVEQAGSTGGGHQRQHLPTAAGFTEDGDIVRIPAKGGDVVLHPLQSRNQIHLTVVAGAVVTALGTQIGVRDITERPETMVHRNLYHALAGQCLRVVERPGVAGQGSEATPMEPDHHWQLVGVLGCRHVEVQGVFTHAALAEALQGGILRGLIAPGDGLAGSLPGFQCLGGAPAQLADRRLRVGDTQELPGIGVSGETAQLAVGGLHHHAFAGGTKEVFQCVLGLGYPPSPGVGVGEGAGAFQCRQQGREAGAEIGAGLVKVDVGCVARYFLADGLGKLDAVIQITVSIQGLQQDQPIHHPGVLCTVGSLGNAQRGNDLGAGGRAQCQLTDGEVQGFIAAIAELALVIGHASPGTFTFVIQPGYGAVDEGAGEGAAARTGGR